MGTLTIVKILLSIGLDLNKLFKEEDSLGTDAHEKLRWAENNRADSRVVQLATLFIHTLPLCFLLKKGKKGKSQFKLIPDLNFPSMFMGDREVVEFFGTLGILLEFHNAPVKGPAVVASEGVPSFATIQLKTLQLGV